MYTHRHWVEANLFHTVLQSIQQHRCRCQVLYRFHHFDRDCCKQLIQANIQHNHIHTIRDDKDHINIRY